MLKVLLCTEAKLSSEDVKRFEQEVVEAGGKPIAAFTEYLPSMNELFKYNPEVVIAGGGEPVSLIWSFLLRLRSFRVQGREWPKVILGPYPARGRYIPEEDHYDEKAADYFYYHPPYCDLYDISLESLWFYIGSCLPVLEVEYLAHTTGLKKEWLLTDGQTDYGKLTFKHLEYILSHCPKAVCAFRAYSSFSDLRPLFGQKHSFKVLQLHLKPVGEMMRVDKFLLDPDKFDLSIEEEEVRFRLWPTARSYPED